MNSATAKPVTWLPLERSSRAFGTDELNICEFPLATTGRAASKGQTSLVFEDEIKDRGTGERVKRKLNIMATEKYGLPTPADSDVLLVLMHLTNTRNGFSDPVVRFTRYELVKFLGWPLCGKSYKRIDESLHRFVNVTLSYNQAWWSRAASRWQTKSFHILESVDLHGKDDQTDDGYSTIVWSKVILESFLAQQTKRLDLETYFRLKLPTAKQAYRFLDKRFYKTNLLNFPLKLFACEHVGLARTYDNGQLKRKLQPAIEELESVGFLQPLSLDERYTKTRPGEWFIHLVRAGAANDEPEPEEPEMSPVVEALMERGIRSGVASALAAQHSETHIRSKIAMVDQRLAQGGGGAVKNPAGFLAAAIRHDYQDGAHQATPRRPTPIVTAGRRKAAQRPCHASSCENPNTQTVREYLATLSPDATATLEAAAVASGQPIIVQSYERLRVSSSPLFEEVRLVLLAAHLEQAGLLANGMAVSNSSNGKRLTESAVMRSNTHTHRQQVTGKLSDTTEPMAFRELEPVGSAIGDAE